MTSSPTPSSPKPSRGLLFKLVAAAFLTTILVLAVASVDIARGQNVVTASPLVTDLLRTSDERRCDLDVTSVAARHLAPGLSRREARGVLDAAVIEKPRPWFWTVTDDGFVTDAGAEIRFRRVIRHTAFGNQAVVGAVAMEGEAVRQVSARMICPFN